MMEMLVRGMKDMMSTATHPLISGLSSLVRNESQNEPFETGEKEQKGKNHETNDMKRPTILLSRI